MGLMPVTDAVFMLPEGREQPMHVGGLQIFDLPAGAGPEYVAEVYHRVLTATGLDPAFRRRAYRSALTLGQWTWVEDRDVDLEHHIRLSALPRPGRVRELLALVSRLHGTLLDRERPLWEAYLIEGLEGDRFAVYTKVHHAMMDGVSATRLLERSLSTDPEAKSGAPWMPLTDARPPRRARPGPGLAAVPGLVRGAAGDALTLAPRVLRIAASGAREPAAALPGQAPRSILNVPITGSRRFAAQSWPMARLIGVARAGGVTLNDVVLAMCSSALRDYLIELEALPDADLIAMTPVSLRQPGDDGAGNAVATILCNLATTEADPVARLEAVHTSMDLGKAHLRSLSGSQRLVVSGAVMAPLLLNTVVGIHHVTRPPFNIVISNVPGPREPLYWNGARLRGMYPLSIPFAGQALNITCTSYADELHFGLIGCRRAVPRLQRLLIGLENALVDLETAFGLG